MADFRFRVLRGETEHRTKLSRVTVNRHQQTRREPYTSSVEGNVNNTGSNQFQKLLVV